MYRLTDIQNGLKNLVGWEQSFDPSKAIADQLTISESGLTFQGAHPLLTLDNMEAIIPDDFNYIYPEWNEMVTYAIGSKVRYEDNIKIAKKANIGTIPTDIESWSDYNYLSDYLERLTLNGISTSIQKFIQIKQLNQETQSLLDHRTFFDGSGRLQATIQNRGKLCGYEIVPVRSMGVSTKIERIGLQMTGAVGKVKMYLFHSSQIDPIKTFELDFTNTKGGFQWFDVQDCYMPYISDTNNAGGSWFLCYNQSDLPSGMEAINISKDWSREPCGTCNMGDVQSWRLLTKYLQISPFNYLAPTTFSQYPELWDIEHSLYTNTVNYGINVEISVGCDLTDFIISQRQLFATVVQKQVAANALRTLAMNPSVNVNRNQVNASRMDILYELDGNTSGIRPGGLGYELKKAYDALSLDTRGLDRICLKCNNGGVKYRTT